MRAPTITETSDVHRFPHRMFLIDGVWFRLYDSGAAERIYYRPSADKHYARFVKGSEARRLHAAAKYTPAAQAA